MPVSNDFLAWVIDQLGGINATSRRMFGGVGLYAYDLFFGLIDDDVLYLKVDDSNRGEYEARGSQPFKPFPDRSSTMQYYAVPADVLEDQDELVAWTRKALSVAETATLSKSKKRASEKTPKKLASRKARQRP